MMAKALGVRLVSLQLIKGTRSRSRTLVVEGLSPEEVFGKLQASVGRITTQLDQDKDGARR